MEAAAAGMPRREVQVIGLITIAHFLSHFYMMALAPLYPLIQPDIGASWSTIGGGITAFALATGVLQTPMGFVVDRFGGQSGASPNHRSPCRNWGNLIAITHHTLRLRRRVRGVRSGTGSDQEMEAAAAGMPRREVQVIGLITIAHFLSHFYMMALAPLYPLIQPDIGASWSAIGGGPACAHVVEHRDVEPALDRPLVLDHLFQLVEEGGGKNVGIEIEFHGLRAP